MNHHADCSCNQCYLEDQKYMQGAKLFFIAILAIALFFIAIKFLGSGE